jgi:hypothetical protein
VFLEIASFKGQAQYSSAASCPLLSGYDVDWGVLFLTGFWRTSRKAIAAVGITFSRTREHEEPPTFIRQYYFCKYCLQKIELKYL